MDVRVFLLLLLRALGTKHDRDSSSYITHFNLTHIIYNTILYCGPSFVCDKSYLEQFGIFNHNESSFSTCGTCYCSEKCFYLEDKKPCCPDVFFKYGYTKCMDFGIIDGYKNANAYPVISSCPSEADASQVMNCIHKQEDIILANTPPVFSYINKQYYKNKYCALCNNQTDFWEWDAEFVCPETTDFNFMSSSEEIKQTIKEKNCSIMFSMPSADEKCASPKEHIISSCNVSRTWRHYDEQIQMACHSGYDTLTTKGENKFKFSFRNIFCAMCNPPNFDLSLSRLTAECSDVTYNWPCQQLSDNEASFPYKNHFCLMCNHDVFSMILQDVVSNQIMEKFDASSNFPFVTELSLTFKSGNLKDHITKLLRYNNHSSNFHHNLTPSINMTNFVRTSFALSDSGVCDPELLPSYTKPLQRNCSCELGCMSTCCDDFALMQPWTCTKDRFPSHMLHGLLKSYLAIGGCLQNSQMFFHLCTDNNSSDIYQMLPVAAKFQNRENYANVFCFLCNQKQVDDQLIEKVTTDLAVWGIVMQCKAYLNYRYFSTLQDYTNFALQNLCFMQFTPSDNAVACYSSDTNSTDFISKCVENVELALDDDEDVKRACEQIEDYRFPKVVHKEIVYKNKFCVLCNNVNMRARKDSCEGTNNLTTLLNKTCLEFPSTPVCSEHRNRFCQMCYEESSSQCISMYKQGEESESTTIPPYIPPINVDVFRFAFSILAYDQDTHEAIRSNTFCLSSQVYDDFFDSCENITCLPGKTLVNESCLPLLEKTNNLRYTFAVKLQLVEAHDSNTSMDTFLRMLRKSIIETLSKEVQAIYIVEDFVLLSFTNCQSKVSMFSEVYIHLKIFLEHTVYRRKTDQDVLMFLINSLEVRTLYDMDSWKVKLVPDQLGLYLPSILWKINADNICWVLEDEVSRGNPIFRNVLVDPLLTCPQVLLKNNAFGVSWENLQITFSLKALTFTFPPFQQFDGEGIRLCVKDIPHYVKRYRFIQNNDKKLFFQPIITITCIGISLVCLALTFITYLTFTCLQTVPGLNNMFLIASLFLAQFILLVRQFSVFSDYDARTISISVATHYLWLSTFFWLQVCSFHMFRVFTSKVGLNSQKVGSSRIVVQHACYAFGTPVGIISFNIVGSLIASLGKETGYDKMSTLFTFKTAFILTFITPLVFVCITNLIFYTISIYKIVSCSRIERTSGNKTHISVYIKLFSLTGLTWILQIVDTFLEVSVLSHIVAVLNGLQGLFIFVSYVCNARVIKMWKEVFGLLKSKDDKNERTDTQ